MHKCNKCGKDFEYNYLLKKHQNRKFTCETSDNIELVYDNKIRDIENEINIKTELSLEEGNKCMFCDLSFSTKTSTSRHIKRFCKIKKELLLHIDKIKEDKVKIMNNHEIKTHYNEIKIRDDEIKNKNDEIKALKEELRSKPSQQVTQNITINNPTINNTQNNLIIINAFGKEDLSHITLEDYKKYLNGFFPAFIKYIEKVHFDNSAPQNHNICISNLKSKYLSIHDGDKWITKEKNDVIDRLINKKHTQLTLKCDELIESKQIGKKIIDNYEEFCGNFIDKEAKKATKSNVMMMIYDNKDKVKIHKNKSKSKIKLDKQESETNENENDKINDEKNKKK